MLKKEELLDIRGGLAITGSLLTAFAKAVETIFNLGRSLGSSLNMIINKRKC
jgi:hypothetical protein